MFTKITVGVVTMGNGCGCSGYSCGKKSTKGVNNGEQKNTQKK